MQMGIHEGLRHEISLRIDGQFGFPHKPICESGDASIFNPDVNGL
jgi:hypothetical protein